MNNVGVRNKTQWLVGILASFFLVGFVLNIVPEPIKTEIHDIVFNPAEAKRIPPLYFIGFSIVALIFPGIPGSALFFLAGRFFGLRKGFVVMVIGNQLGTSISFLCSRYLCYQWVNLKVNANVSLLALRNAAKKNQWTILFLSRFILIPTQVKSYVFGVSPARWLTFFVTVFLGDLQSMFIGIYLGNLFSGKVDSSSTSSFEKRLTMLGFVFALIMSLIASYFSKKYYQQELNELNMEVKTRRCRNSSTLSFISTLSADENVGLLEMV